MPTRTAQSNGSGSAPREARPVFIHPAFRCLPPPVIVIGMHRSGTSLAAAMLARLGVYMGPESASPESLAELAVPMAGTLSSGYAEAADFFALNEAILARAGATWSRIDPLVERRNDGRFTAAAVSLLQRATFGRLHRRYLSRVPDGDARHWGWKDPRNSLILPYWLRLFPEARVLHVRRDIEGAAASLCRRARGWTQEPPAPPTSRARFERLLLDPAAALRYAGRRLGIVPPPPSGPDPCLDLEYCRNLSREYIRECLQYRALRERYLEVWYEDILDQPAALAGELARFASLPAEGAVLERAGALVVPREKLPDPGGVHSRRA